MADNNWYKYEKYILYRAYQCKVPLIPPEDVAQELRITLWKALDKYDKGKAKEVTYAITVLNNKIIDLKRRAFRDVRKADLFSISLDELENV